MTLISSRLPLPAREPPPLDREKERQITAGSGLKLLQSSPGLVPAGSSLRMFVDCLVSKGDWFSTICSLEWKKTVTKSGRSLLLLRASERLTEGNESGLSGEMLMTPEAKNHEGYQRANGKKYLRLGTQIAMLPTPDANDATRGAAKVYDRKSKKQQERTCQTAVEIGIDLGKKSPEKPAGRMRLAPEMTEFLMGLPQGYTALTAYPKPPTAAKGSKRAGTQ